MNGLLISLAAFIASGLTLFSGFGLGTLLMPVFALFFPVPLAIAATGVVHFFNNLFKVLLLGRYADKRIIVRFGAPALGGAFLGARLLGLMADVPALTSYRLFGVQRYILPVNVAVAVLMLCFALAEFLPRLRDMSFKPRHLLVGGVISGFFGGLSGHQGALRGAFLARSDLSREEFIGTSAVLACLVDVVRLTVYGRSFAFRALHKSGALLALATLAAFLGTWIGSRLIEKVTLRAIQIFVAVMLFGIALGLACGII